MRIACLGSTSQIARDLIVTFAKQTDYECTLFARDPSVVENWLRIENIQKGYIALDYQKFCNDVCYDVIINFVGVGDPARAKDMGVDIFDVTLRYDMMVLEYLQVNPDTKYIFLSSGAVYGGGFEEPVSNESDAIIPINNLTVIDSYAISKLYAEARHRALSDLSIIDVRVFNYFSHMQDFNARFLMTDIVRALQSGEMFFTSPDNIIRDFITPVDFFNLISALINYKPANMAIDCYTKSPVDKFSLLSELKEKHGLRYEVTRSTSSVNATGAKIKYYSLNKMSDEIGYHPEKTSLEGVLDEVSLIGELEGIK